MTLTLIDKIFLLPFFFTKAKMTFHFFLLSALLVSVRAGIQPWRPCSRLNSTDCVSSDFASLPTNGVGSDAGQSSTGTWSVAGNVMREIVASERHRNRRLVPASTRRDSICAKLRN
jgi:hypothetical protein